MIKIAQRSVPDPAGRPVDVYPPVRLVSSIIMEPKRPLTRESYRGVLVAALRSIANHTNRRIRDRDFPIFYGEFDTQFDDGLIAVALPEIIDHRIHEMIQHSLSWVGKIREISLAAPVDINAEPFLRYQRGRIILYVDPFSEADAGEETGEEAGDWSGTEKRSYEFRGDRQRVERGPSLPSVSFVASPQHSLKSWEENRSHILRFIWDMELPGTFRVLIGKLRRNFGLTVLQTQQNTGRHGVISLGWLDQDATCDVNIEVDRHLSEQLKYVALCHELSHYVLHFPLLLAGQMVEQLSWKIPSLEYYYSRETKKIFGSDKGLLEHHANLLACEMLIPPRLNTAGLAGVVSEVSHRRPNGRLGDEELRWRLLQPLFPETDQGDDSWSALDALEERAEFEIAASTGASSADAGSLYQAMVSAALARENGATKELSERVDEKMSDLWSSFGMLYGRAIENPVEHGTSVDASGLHGGEVVEGRKLLPPLQEGRYVAPRIPLVPERPGANDSWVNILDSSEPPRPVEDWRARHPRQAMVLYPGRTVPSGSLYG